MDALFIDNAKKADALELREPLMLKPISVLILTKNEELDLPDCLASVRWSDDVHVLDSFSTDRTRSIAEEAGVHFVEQRFMNYATQRNVGLALPFKYAWVLVLDADERMTPALADEMARFVVDVPEKVAAARLRRRDIWWGRWLKHAQMSPFYIRLMRVGRAQYEREVNEVLTVDGEIHDLNEPFDHYPFSKGLDHWIEKHNKYSHMEASMLAAGSANRPSWRSAVLGKDFNERRGHQKALFYRMPFRPLMKFFYIMLIRRAFLDGLPGVRYSILLAIYEYFIVLKTEEIRSRNQSLGR